MKKQESPKRAHTPTPMRRKKHASPTNRTITIPTHSSWNKRKRDTRPDEETMQRVRGATRGSNVLCFTRHRQTNRCRPRHGGRQSVRRLRLHRSNFRANKQGHVQTASNRGISRARISISTYTFLHFLNRFIVCVSTRHDVFTGDGVHFADDWRRHPDTIIRNRRRRQILANITSCNVKKNSWVMALTHTLMTLIKSMTADTWVH